MNRVEQASPRSEGTDYNLSASSCTAPARKAGVAAFAAREHGKRLAVKRRLRLRGLGLWRLTRQEERLFARVEQWKAWFGWRGRAAR